MASGCEGQVGTGPADLTDGIWSFQAGPSEFLWEFSTKESGELSCLVHEILGGKKFLETPCESVALLGDTLVIQMPTGVGYRGVLDLSRGTVSGGLLYPGGGGPDAQFRWAPVREYPTLRSRPEGEEAYSYRPPEALDDGWPVGSPEELGVDRLALERTVSAIGSGEAGFLKSFLVVRNGTLILEEYFHEYGKSDLSPLMSCTKSVSSLLVGLAIQEGRIDGEDVHLLDFFPDAREETGSGWGRLTLKHLLTMSLALDWSPEEAENLHGTGPDAFRQILARNVVGRPGEVWQYVNMNVNLLAGVLHQATGEHAESFARRALFEPLGITEWSWDHGRTEGFNLMDGSLRLRPRDMARLGALVLAGGSWQGRQVVNEEWIRRSITPHLSAGPGSEGYGYLWWTMDLPDPAGPPLRVVFANGWGSQFILVFPAQDLVVVTTGGNQENGKHLAIGEVLVEHLLPGVGSPGDSPPK
ncbi:serine hydrolase domain-containing protein [Gemmatimonadota bacterium]